MSRASHGPDKSTDQRDVWRRGGGRLDGESSPASVDSGEGRLRDSEASRPESLEGTVHDLHDMAVRRLFTTSMRLQSALPFIEHHEAMHRVRDAIADVDQVIRDIRSAVLSIECVTAAWPHSSLRARVAQLADEVAFCLGYRPQVVVDDPVDVVAGPREADQAITSLRASLMALMRHAAVPDARIRISATDEPTPRLVVAVTAVDNAIGSDTTLYDWAKAVGERIVEGGGVTSEHASGAVTVTWICVPPE